MEYIDPISITIDAGISLLIDVAKALFCCAKNEIENTIYNKKLCQNISKIISKYDLTSIEKQNLISWIDKDLNKIVKKGFSKTSTINDVVNNIRDQLANKFKEFKIEENDINILLNDIEKIVLETYEKRNPESYKLYKLDKIYDSLISEAQSINDKLSLLNKDYENTKNIDQYDEWLKKTYHKDGFVMSLDFFEVDDNDFLEQFPSELNKSYFSIIHNDIEEGVGCVLHTLRKIGKDKNVYVVFNQQTWDSLEGKISNCILLANFKSDQIRNISDCTCIYFSPNITNSEYIELRKRKIETLEKKLIDGGYPNNKVHKLLKDKNGLYSGISYNFFNGSIILYKEEKENLNSKIIKTLLLVKGFTLEDRDLDFITDLFGLDKTFFKDSIIDICHDEKYKLLYEKSRYSKKFYTLSNFEGSWYSLGNYISKDEFVHFCENYTVEMVKYLNGILPPSKFMMESILEMVDFVICVYHKYWQSIGDNLVRKLLNECLNDDNLFCKLICEFGYILVDISPNSYIEFCEENLLKLQNIIENKLSDKYLVYGNPYTSLVWQIGNAIQYDEETYALQSISILMNIMEWNIKDNGSYVKEQINKCVWAGFNYSGLNRGARVELFKKIIQENPKKGWSIAYDAAINSSIMIATGGSLYRPVALDYSKYNVLDKDLYLEYCQILKESANLDGLVKILDDYPFIRMPEDDLNNICDNISQQLSTLSDFDAFGYELKLRKKVYDIRYFQRSYFNNLNDIVEKMVSIFSNIQYKNKLMKHLYCLCFSLDFFPIIDPIPYKQGNLYANNEKIELHFKREYKLLIDEDYSLSQLLNLYFDYKSYKGSTSKNIVNNLIAMSREFDNDILDIYIKNNKLEDAACYFVSTLKNKVNFYELVSNTKNDVLKGMILRYERNLSKDFFEKLKNESEETREAYWSRFVPKLDNKEIAVAAFNSFPSKSKINNEQLLFILLNSMYFDASVVVNVCLDNIELLKTDSLYYVKEFLDKLSSIELDDDTLLKKIVKLEYHIGCYKNNKYLNLLLAKQPDVLCKILSNVYECKKGKDNIDNNSIYCYSIFYQLQFCPGESEISKSIPSFAEWYEEFIKIYNEYGFDKDIELVIGHLLPNSRLNDDGLPLQDSVRNYIEKHYNKTLRNAFWIAESNKRGVYTVNGGEGTFTLANNYLEISDKFKEKGFDNLAKLYKVIGEDYKNQALNEREDSENVR